jgi:hypothetical protein
MDKLPLVLFLLMIAAVQLAVNYWLLSGVKRETERKIWAGVSDYVVERSKNPQSFLGYDTQTAARITRIAREFYLDPAILAAIGAHENGFIQNETGYLGPTKWNAAKWRIRTLYPDPLDYPWAYTANMLTHIAMHRCQKSDQLGPWLTDVGREYNLTSEDWTRKVEDIRLWYAAERSIPATKKTARRVPGKVKGRAR